MTVYDDADEYCPHCDNHYVRVGASSKESILTRIDGCAVQVVEAKTPQAMLVAESEDSRIDSR